MVIVDNFRELGYSMHENEGKWSKIFLKKAVTISSIAKEAGVSVSTVSRVLNNKPDVMPETRERIQQVIEAHQFQASAYAKGIAEKSCRTIAMVIGHDVDYVFTNQYFTQVLRGIIVETQKRGYYVLSLYCQDVLEAMNAFRQQRIDGILLVSPTLDQKEAVQTFVQNGVPLVAVGTFDYCKGVPCVEVDDYTGTARGMEHLISCGHRRIAYIGGPGKVPSTGKRLEAYLAKMEEHGCPVLPGMVQKSDGVINSTSLVDRILQAVPDVTAIFAGSDFVAIGVMNALQSKGYRVPEDISVMGFDDVPMSAQMVPKLTTVRQDGDRKGATAASMLIDWVESGKKPEENVTVKTELMVRQSVCDLR